MRIPYSARGPGRSAGGRARSRDGYGGQQERYAGRRRRVRPVASRAESSVCSTDPEVSSPLARWPGRARCPAAAPRTTPTSPIVPACTSIDVAVCAHVTRAPADAEIARRPARRRRRGSRRGRRRRRPREGRERVAVRPRAARRLMTRMAREGDARGVSWRRPHPAARRLRGARHGRVDTRRRGPSPRRRSHRHRVAQAHARTYAPPTAARARRRAVGGGTTGLARSTPMPRTGTPPCPRFELAVTVAPSTVTRSPTSCGGAGYRRGHDRAGRSPAARSGSKPGTPAVLCPRSRFDRLGGEPLDAHHRADYGSCPGFGARGRYRHRDALALHAVLVEAPCRRHHQISRDRAPR